LKSKQKEEAESTKYVLSISTKRKNFFRVLALNFHSGNNAALHVTRSVGTVFKQPYNEQYFRSTGCRVCTFPFVLISTCGWHYSLVWRMACN
jgi:hypothetical protein